MSSNSRDLYESPVAEDVNPTQTTSQPSIYTPLVSQTDQIRLLKLDRTYEPKGTSDVIRGELSTHWLQSLPTFDALSYAWGAGTVKSQVLLDENFVDVTENLFAALGTLRRSVAVCSYLWVDALCIDQQNIPERNSQVTLMKGIYTQARTVHVYLGQSRSITAPILTMFRQTVDQSLHAAEERRHAQNSEEARDPVATPTPHWEDAWDCIFNDFFQDDWYHRLWVVQEVVLASHPLVHIGQHTIPFWDLIAGLTKILGIRLTARTNKDPVWRITRIQARFLGAYNGKSTLAYRMLLATADCKHSVEHDRVYAVLGLIPDRIYVVPDYSKPIAAVYEEFTVACIVCDQNLDILATAGIHRWRKDSGPSWVPSWNHTPAMLFSGYEEYDASGRDRLKGSNVWPSTLAVSRGDETLCVWAYIIEDIVSVSELLPDNATELVDQRYIISEKIGLGRYTESTKECIAQFRKTREPHEDDVDILAAFWYMLFTPPVNDADVALGASFQAWIGSSDSETVSKENQEKLADRFKYFAGRRFFTTATHRMAGMTTGLVEAGDVLGIIAGANTPYVLRRMSTNGHNVYRLIGHVRCEGLMRGESILEAARSGNGDSSVYKGVFDEITIE